MRPGTTSCCNLFERAGDTPYSLANPDGTGYSVFAGLDPTPDGGARQNRVDGVHSAPRIE